MKLFKQLFCKHDWNKIGFREEEENNIRYSMRHYKCGKCGKEKWVDGRNDTIANPKVIIYGKSTKGHSFGSTKAYLDYKARQ